MSALEWLDLETLATDIAAARARLVDVNAYREVGRVQALEQQIADAEERRDRLLARLTDRIAELPDAARQAETMGVGEPQIDEEQPLATPASDTDKLSADIDRTANSEIPEEIILAQEGSAETGEPSSLRWGVARSDLSPAIDSIEGLSSMWDEITPTHIEQAMSELDARRAEILAQHAEELKTLDAEHAEIEFLEHSIDVFTQKFGNGLASGDQQQP